MRPKNPYSARWRQTQAEYNKATRRQYFRRNLVVAAAVLICLIGGLLAVYFVAAGLSGPYLQDSPVHAEKQANEAARVDSFSRPGLMNFLADAALLPDGLSGNLVWEKDDARFRITTTINSKLQKYTLRLLRRSMTLQSAVVVLDPYDGRVLVLASRDKNGNRDNLCLMADYPAASLFKIVSAAAALETAGYSPGKSLFYNGGRHTLYKYQLKESQGRYSMATTFRKAFAASNNSVFGKIGIYDLGQQTLVDYAERFRFNQQIPFDLPVEASTISVPDDDFGLAEIASGFNKGTLLSPLHAALLATVAVNGGRMPKPRLVNTVTEEMNEIVYQSYRSELPSSVSGKTAAAISLMMQDAARYGTSRTTFRKLRRHRLFKDLDFGAKTGTINDQKDQHKIDWMTAFAVNPAQGRGICVGVLAVHGEKLGTRSSELARAIIDYHFKS